MHDNNEKQADEAAETKDNPVERGQEAIKMQRELVDKDKSAEQKDSEEQQDAEDWHNEG